MPDLKAPKKEEAEKELAELQTKIQAIPEDIKKLNDQYVSLNLRAAFLQGVIASS